MNSAAVGLFSAGRFGICTQRVGERDASNPQNEYEVAATAVAAPTTTHGAPDRT